MKVILIIAINTYREIIRDRVLYGLLVFALLLIGMSLALGQLSFAEQARISADFGLTAIHISAIVFSIFVGSTLVYREIDKKTIMTLLVRPISRLQFVLGKCLGLSLVTMTSVFCLAFILWAVFLGVGMDVTSLFPLALYGVLLGALLLLGVTIFFSSFASPMMVVSFSVGIFIIGHWISSLNFFASKSKSEGFRIFAKALIAISPDLEKFNWRSHVIYKDALSLNEVSYASLYSLSWFLVLILTAVFLFRRRDFG